MYNNYAISLPVSEIFVVSKISIINNSTFRNNTAYNKQYVMNQLSSCTDLCFFSDSYKQFLQQSESSLNINAIPYSFQTVSSSLIIQNDTLISSQPYLINAYLSVITFDNTQISTISSDNYVIKISTSNITITDTQMSDLYSTDTNGILIFLISDSEMIMTNLAYSNSFMKLIRVHNSKCMISDSMITNIDTSNSNLISFYSSKDTVITNTVINNITSSNSKIIDISYSTVSTISNVTINEVYTTVFRMTGSTLSNAIMLQFFNVTQAISITQTNLTIRDSNFTRCGGDIAYGGAIDLIDSVMLVNNSEFVSNSAQSGAAISLRCSSISACTIDIMNSNFKQNQASTQGGAIYYNFVRPSMARNIFMSNTAGYGDKIASYAVRIVQVGSMDQNIVLDGAASGIDIVTSPTSTNQSSLNLALVDFDDQIMNLVSTSNIKIVGVDSNTEVIGISEVRATEGMSNFTDVSFINFPGAENVKFMASSLEIDQNKAQHYVFPTDNSISVTFRYCKPGEFIDNNGTICTKCSAGTFSFKWNSTRCTQCMNNAV